MTRGEGLRRDIRIESVKANEVTFLRLALTDKLLNGLTETLNQRRQYGRIELGWSK